MRILIVVEETATGYSAYSPDVPGCAATGRTRDDVEQTMQEAIVAHLDALRESGDDVPPPKSYATYVDVAA
jgi:predicted RNase H-like HicB family nuclease